MAVSIGGIFASRRLHLHFYANPVEVLGEDGKVSGFRYERTRATGFGGVEGTGEGAAENRFVPQYGHHGETRRLQPADGAQGEIGMSDTPACTDGNIRQRMPDEINRTHQKSPPKYSSKCSTAKSRTAEA